MASSSLVVASPAQPRRRNQPLALPTSTTPALHVTRLVEAKTRFCQFCGNRFCGVFRPKRACDGCGGVVCDGCLSKMETTRANQPLRVCPGCDVRLKACPNFTDHMVARQEHGAGIYHTVTTASSQTSPPASPSSSSSSSSSTVCPTSTPSPPSVAFSSIATQTLPCVVFAPSPSCQAPTSVHGCTINMTMRPPFTPEPRPSVSPLAWLLRAIGDTDNDNSSTNNSRRSGSIGSSSNTSNNIRSSSGVSSSSRNNIAITTSTSTNTSTSTSTSTSTTNTNSNSNSNSSNNNGANQQAHTFAFRMDQGEEFLRTKVTTITQGILTHRYGVTGVAAVVVGVSGLAAFLGRSRSRR